MFTEARVRIWTDEAGLPVIGLDETPELAPTEALEVAERLRQIAAPRRGWPVVTD